MIALAQVGDHEDAPPVRMPARDIGRVDPRVAAIVPHQFRRRGRRIDDEEPSLGAGVGHLIHQQASLRRPLVVADSAGARLFERNHLDLTGIDAKQPQRSPLVLVAGISTAQLVHRGLGAEIVGERHLPQVPAIGHVERDRPAVGRPRKRRPVRAPHAGAHFHVGAVVGAQRHAADSLDAECRQPLGCGAAPERPQPDVAVAQKRQRRAVRRERDVGYSIARAQLLRLAAVHADAEDAAARDEQEPAAVGQPLDLAHPAARAGRGLRSEGVGRCAGWRRWRRIGSLHVGEALQSRPVGAHDVDIAKWPAALVPAEGDPATVGRPGGRCRRRADDAGQLRDAFDREAARLRRGRGLRSGGRRRGDEAGRDQDDWNDAHLGDHYNPSN